MKMNSLISVVFAAALFACAPAIAAEVSVYAAPAGIPGVHPFVAAMAVLVAALAVLVLVLTAVQAGGSAVGGFTGRDSGRERRPLLPGEVMLRKPPG